jgi:hypothetical protein
MESKPLDLEVNGVQTFRFGSYALESKPLDLEVTLWSPNL